MVTGEYPPMQGGVGAYTQALARALAATGVPVSVITSRRAAHASDIDGSVPVNAALDGWGWRSPGAIAAHARSIGAEWIHVQYQTAAFGMHPAINFAPWLWRRQGLRVAWTYHDLLVPYLFPKAGAGLRRWVTERPAFLADVTIVTNEQDRAQLAGRVSDLHSIPIGSNIQGRTLTAAERARLRRDWGFDDGSLLLAYFGFLNRSKGALTLVESLHRLVAQGRDAHLLMIGERVGASDPTNYAYLQGVEEQIAARGLAGRVRWTGRLDDADVAAALNAVDVLVMPYVDGASTRRGTLMAGLANGCAVVTTTPRYPIPEMRDGQEWLTVPPEAPDAIVAAVARIADDPVLADSLRNRARAASRLFSWEGIAARHLPLYGLEPVQSSQISDPRSAR